MSDLYEHGKKISEKIHEQREEILEAFIAKYGCEPQDLVQIIQQTEEGIKFFVRVRTHEEKRMLSMNSAGL
jgi:chorismate mutase